jgi:cation transport regulator ChaC
MAKIFGYGSLMNIESLRQDVPSAQNLIPAYIKGYHREFSMLDSCGVQDSKTGLCRPYCALDVMESAHKSEVVNGVVFEVDDDYFDALCAREHDYTTVKTTVYDYLSHISLGDAYFFSSGKRNGQYMFGDEEQSRYLLTCITGARSFGGMFLSDFLTSTYTGSSRLADSKKLRSLYGGL